MAITVGTAGWGIPRDIAAEFPGDETNLERYARVFDGVEINTSFQRAHRRETYEKWANSVGASFRFAVKIPRAITHEARLGGVEKTLDAFLEQVGALGAKLGPLLVQFPPSFAFDARLFGSFCSRIRERGRYLVACEPRHPSWFETWVDQWLADRKIARVAADPALHPGAGTPGGWRGLAYYRLHGAPRVYFSAYDRATLADLEEKLARQPTDTAWCVFDNTASGAAAADALILKAGLANRSARPASR
jgi:uncharacterized protein YecE (DUF72 family)